MAAKAGKRANVKISGTPVAATAMACTDLGTNEFLRYQISDTSKRILSPTGAVTVKVGGTPTSVASIDRLFGIVTFADALDGDAVVTVDASYLPVTTVAGAHDYSYEIDPTSVDVTTFEDGQTDGYTRRVNVQHDVSGTVERFYQSDTLFVDALIAGATVLLEFWADTDAVDCRMWAVFEKDDVKAAAADVVGESIDFVGNADADGRSVSYG